MWGTNGVLNIQSPQPSLFHCDEKLGSGDWEQMMSLAIWVLSFLFVACFLVRRVHLKGGVFTVGWDLFCLRSVMYWMKNPWASRSSIQLIPRIISVNAEGSRAGSGRLSGAWLSRTRHCACRALQTARKCIGSSSSELQSLHIGFPVGLPSLLTLNLAASLSRPCMAT